MPYYHNNLPILCKIVTLIYLSFCQIFRKFGSFRTYFEQCLLGNRNLKRGYYHWFSGDFAHILTASGKTQDRLYSSAHEIYFKRVRSSGRSISWLIASSSVWTIKSSHLWNLVLFCEWKNGKNCIICKRKTPNPLKSKIGHILYDIDFHFKKS